MEWPNDPDDPISNISKLCLLENIEEAHPPDVAYEEGVYCTGSACYYVMMAGGLLIILIYNIHVP